VDEDIEKMVMKTKHGSYEFLVMPFGLCNVPLMFTTFMNFIFHEKLDDFVINYIDNILVYSKTIEEYTYLEYVLNKFQQNIFLPIEQKNEFVQKEMDFLGKILSREGMKHDLTKLQAIKD
jgi:hypothetical protein